MSAEETWQQRRARFDNLLTLFGRKPVLEALRSDDIRPVRLHLATSNRDSADLREMRAIAGARGVEVVQHTRRELSRISKNGKQDQGVAIDIGPPRYMPVETLMKIDEPDLELVAVDSVTNPQNLGMIVRSIAASPMHGVIIARRGSARIDGLVVKASAGTLFKCRIYHCTELAAALTGLRTCGFCISGLDSQGDVSIEDVPSGRRRVFVLGNETTGLSPDVDALCDERVKIPLRNGVESLNVSVAAALVAFRETFLHRT